MADKNSKKTLQHSTLILKVDLDCHLCYKKIKKVLCKLQEKEDIKAIIYDEKSKSIMIAGPFNPDKVSSWLCCRACKVIKEIEVKDYKPKDGKQKDGKPKDSKPADDGKPKDGKPKDGKPKDDKPKDDKPKDDKPKDGKAPNGKPKDDKPKGDKDKNGKPDSENPKDGKPPKSVKFDSNPVLIPQKAQLEPPKNGFGMMGPYPQMSYQPGWPSGMMGQMGQMGVMGQMGQMGRMGAMGPMGQMSQMGPMGEVVPAAPSCCFRPLYEGFSGGYRCCTCGTVCGYGVAAPPVGYYGGHAVVDPYRGNQFFCEEESSCSLM